MTTQTTTGKAFEYAIAMQLADICSCALEQSPAMKTAHEKMLAMKGESKKEWDNMRKAANEAVLFLCSMDSRLSMVKKIKLLPDSAGKDGDVRDVIAVCYTGEEVGISAKNRNDAVKHNRLSDKMDFAEEWLQLKCSEVYFKAINPIFEMLRENKGKPFRDIPNRHSSVYLPVLLAFKQEIERQQDLTGLIVAPRLMQFLIGKFDFYKVIKENGHVSVSSFNMLGTMRWGNKWEMPTKIKSIEFTQNKQNNLDMILDKGWALSFRIHNASSKCEPSLKFDVRIQGWPTSILKSIIKIKNY